MKSISLNNDLELVLEPIGKSARLIIVKGEKEFACRKDTFRNLNRFLAEHDERLFKGRLQLFKYCGEIEIILNKMPIGKISTNHFYELLNS